MDKLRVGILRGGNGYEYETSIDRGGDILREVIESLSTRWKPIDILIDRDGTWHAGGLPIQPADLINKVDVVWNASHPNFSQILNNITVPHNGPSAFPYTLKDNRTMLEEHMRKIGVEMPKSIVFPLFQQDFDGSKKEYAAKKAREVFEKFSPPWIVRSFIPNSTMSVHVARTFPELINAIEDGLMHEVIILVEELISGKVVATHSVAGFRGEDLYNLPIIEIRDGAVSMNAFTQEDKDRLHALAKNIYSHVGARGYLKSNFVVNPTKGIFLTSIDLSPNFKANSHLCRSCEAVSVKIHHIIEHIMEKALKN